MVGSSCNAAEAPLTTCIRGIRIPSLSPACVGRTHHFLTRCEVVLLFHAQCKLSRALRVCMVAHWLEAVNPALQVTLYLLRPVRHFRAPLRCDRFRCEDEEEPEHRNWVCTNWLP